MLKILLLCILFIHGILHMAKFISKKNFTDFSFLQDFPWVLCTLLFISTGVVYFLHYQEWWAFALVSILLSQILIIKNWKEAKAGTIINLIIIPFVLTGFGGWNFNRVNQNEVSSLLHLNNTINNNARNKISDMPPVIAQWLRQSGISDEKYIRNLKIIQTGSMKTSPESDWMPMNAEQYVTVNTPGFVWMVKMEMNKLLFLSGRDIYKNGKGHMLIKALAVYPVVNSNGKEIDQGTLLRYMAEMIWYPNAALHSYMSWIQVDSCKAKATMNYMGVSASGFFNFNPDGTFKSYETYRYYHSSKGYNYEKWVIEALPNSDQWFEGIRVPTQFKVTWKLKEGDFTWLKLNILNIDYNLPDKQN